MTSAFSDSQNKVILPSVGCKVLLHKLINSLSIILSHCTNTNAQYLAAVYIGSYTTGLLNA